MSWHDEKKAPAVTAAVDAQFLQKVLAFAQAGCESDEIEAMLTPEEFTQWNTASEDARDEWISEGINRGIAIVKQSLFAMARRETNSEGAVKAAIAFLRNYASDWEE